MKNPYKAPLTKWEREHAAECINAIAAGYDWSFCRSRRWVVTKGGQTLAEATTRRLASKCAVKLLRAEN